jgi:hypothetical protein
MPIKFLRDSQGNFGIQNGKLLYLPSWTPAEIATQLWLDASDASTITESEGSVSQWDDKSGNDNHATQGSASQQPTYATWQDLPAVEIVRTGVSGDMLETSSNIIGTNDDYTIISVKTNSIGRGVDGAGSGWSIADNASGANVVLTSGGAAQYNANSGGAGFLTTTQLDQNDTQTLRAWLYGDNLTETSAPKTSLRTSTRYFTLGAQNGSAIAGYLGEAIVFTSVISTEVRQKCEGYLAWKWGFVANLPTDHPYRWDGSLFGYGVLWQPAEITTEAWYDASDASTITEAGGAVSQIDDKSGNGVHAVQANGGDQPLIVTGAMNGLDALHFVGRNNYMDGNSLIDFDWAITVIHYLATPAFSQALGSQTIPLLGYTIQYRGDLNIDRWNSSLYTNGNPLSTVGATPVTVGPTIVGRDLQGLSNFHLQLGGDRGLPNRGWDGYIGEVIYGNQTLDTATRQLLEGYLAWKWGLEANLPIGHPYKSAAPTA